MSQEKFEFDQQTAGSLANTQGFRDWHDQYRERLLNSMIAVVRDREMAEDVTAAALGTALERINQFRGESSLYTWVHAIALNEARDCLRQNRTVSLDSMDGNEPTDLAEPDELTAMLERSECCVRLRKALRQLPTLHRRALVDHFVRGYSVRRIARRHGVPLGTVLSRIFTAKKLLRKAWASVPI